MHTWSHCPPQREQQVSYVLGNDGGMGTHYRSPCDMQLAYRILVASKVNIILVYYPGIVAFHCKRNKMQFAILLYVGIETLNSREKLLLVCVSSVYMCAHSSGHSRSSTCHSFL